MLLPKPTAGPPTNCKAEDRLRRRKPAWASWNEGSELGRLGAFSLSRGLENSEARGQNPSPVRLSTFCTVSRCLEVAQPVLGKAVMGDFSLPSTFGGFGTSVFGEAPTLGGSYGLDDETISIRSAKFNVVYNFALRL